MDMDSLKDRIFASQDLTNEVVDIPEWGVKLEVRSMSAGDRSRSIRNWVGEDNQVDLVRFYPAIIAASVFDPESGERVFTDADAEKLNEKSSRVIERLAQVALRLSGMTQEAVDEAGEGS
jgi:hypothetical protein